MKIIFNKSDWKVGEDVELYFQPKGKFGNQLTFGVKSVTEEVVELGDPLFYPVKTDKPHLRCNTKTGIVIGDDLGIVYPDSSYATALSAYLRRTDTQLRDYIKQNK